VIRKSELGPPNLGVRNGLVTHPGKGSANNVENNHRLKLHTRNPDNERTLEKTKIESKIHIYFTFLILKPVKQGNSFG
jgi:hypothetical protein